MHRKWVKLQLIIQEIYHNDLKQYMTVNKRWYVTPKARLASQHHLSINVDLSDPIFDGALFLHLTLPVYITYVCATSTNGLIMLHIN